MNNLDGNARSLTRTSERIGKRRPGEHEERRTSRLIGPVLAAVDVSWHSRAALLWACEHAAIVDAPVTVLHVLHDPAEAPGKYSRNASDILSPMADTGERMLAEFMAEVQENHPNLARLAEARMKVMQGLPARTIVDAAVQLSAALIVMGSRGHTGAPRLIFGSTAQKVVQLSPIPVTVVKT